MVGASRSMSNAELAELIDILTKLPRARAIGCNRYASLFCVGIQYKIKRRLRMGQKRITALARQLLQLLKSQIVLEAKGEGLGMKTHRALALHMMKSCDGCHPPKDSTVYNVLNPIDNTNEVPGVEPQLLVNQPGGVVDCEVSRDWAPPIPCSSKRDFG